MVEGEKKPKRKRLNSRERRALKAEALRLFVKQAGRKTYLNWDPNDRKHDREVEQRAKKMRPEDLDRLLRDGDED